MYVETDLKKIKGLARKWEDENWEFRTFLKAAALSSEELDTIVHDLYAQVTAVIDCRTCANCCKQLSFRPEPEEIKTLANLLKLSEMKFRAQYLVQEGEYKGELQQPCPFLKDKICSVYAHRPKVCASYPHIQRKDFRSRTMQVLNNYEVCPIVFNVYEYLKAELSSLQEVTFYNYY